MINCQYVDSSGVTLSSKFLTKVTSYSLSYNLLYNKKSTPNAIKMGDALRHPFLRRALRGKNRQKHFWVMLSQKED